MTGDCAATTEHEATSLEPFAEQMRMALAEAGYPEAHVYIAASSVFVEGDIPDALVLRAGEIAGLKFVG